jgi:hypothetical protein
MKVTNWRRKLMAGLAAGGLLAPGALHAANLDTNLVANPSFESVDFATTGDYGAPKVLNWLGGPGFAYSHNPVATGIPDYADGADPPGAGDWYFTANNNPGSATGDWRAPGGVYQDIDVSTGATGTQIGIGEAAYKLSAFMSSYLNDNDFGIVHLDFRNASGTSLGTAEIRDSDPGPNNVWSLNSKVGLVPVGTATIRASLFGGVVNGGTDGYIDLVDAQLTAAANELLFLEVNTANGQVAIKNQTGDPVRIDYYEITSAAGSLNATSWDSLQEPSGNPPGFPSGNGSGNGWEEFGGSGPRVIGESFLTGNSTVANNGTVGLGSAFNIGGTRDLLFQYSVVTGAGTNPTGDYNSDGKVDAADYVVWRKNNINGQQGYTDWRTNFGASGAAGGPGTLVGGFVRYVSAGLGAGAAVPEPAGVWLVGVGLASLALSSRRKP